MSARLGRLWPFSPSSACYVNAIPSLLRKTLVVQICCSKSGGEGHLSGLEVGCDRTA